MLPGAVCGSDISVLSAIAASDPRQLPVDVFHISVLAHLEAVNSLRSKRQQQHGSCGPTSQQSPTLTAAECATLMAAIQLVPTTTRPRGGQKRPRQAVGGDPFENEGLCYDVGGVHQLCPPLEIRFGGNEIKAASIPFSAINTSAQAASSSSLTPPLAVDCLYGDVTHTFNVAMFMVSDLLEAESHEWRYSSNTTDTHASVHELIFDLPKERQIILNGDDLAAILTPAMSGPLSRFEQCRKAFAITRERFGTSVGQNVVTTSSVGDDLMKQHGEGSDGDDDDELPFRKAQHDIAKADQRTKSRRKHPHIKGESTEGIKLEGDENNVTHRLSTGEMCHSSLAQGCAERHAEVEAFRRRLLERDNATLS